MSVLIKGMKMPENCCKCEWHESYGGDYDWCHACRLTGNMPIENAELKRSDDCPLIELPEKHGRLIDADDVKSRMIPLSFSVQKWIGEVELSNCKTVIEAEVDEE